MSFAALSVLYKGAARGCAAVIADVPLLERPGMALVRSTWSAGPIGRFSRSVGYRVVDRLRARQDTVRTVIAAGAALRADVSDWVFISLYLSRSEYEPATTAYVKEHLRPGGVFVDVGANSGYFSLLAARFVGPAGKVFAFEPNPAALQALVRHIELNACGERIHVLDTAVCGRSGSDAHFFVTRHSGFSTLTPETSHAGEYLEGGHAIRVRTTTVDEWMTEARVPRIDLLKIDVEGGEHDVIAGASASLAAGRIARLVLETTADSEAYLALLSHGYSATILESVGPVVNVAFARQSKDVQSARSA